MPKVTINLPETMTLFTGDNHELAKFSFADMSADVLARLLSGPSGAVVRALRVVAMNTYNGGGKDASAAEKQAKLDKRLAAWRNGDWAITERGESYYTAWKDEVFIPMCLEQGMSLADAGRLIATKVAEHFPPKTKATFANFIEATAIESADQFDGDRTAAREAIEAFYEAELETRRKARSKAAAKVEMPKIDLSAFKKTK